MAKDKVEFTDEQVAAWKREHGELRSIRARSGSLVFRKPKRVEWDKYTDRMGADNGNRSTHSRELAQSCLVFPTPEGMREILDDQPALLLNEVIDTLGEMAGFGGGDAVVAKL